MACISSGMCFIKDMFIVPLQCGMVYLAGMGDETGGGRRGGEGCGLVDLNWSLTWLCSNQDDVAFCKRCAMET